MNFFVKSLALALDNQDVMRYNNKARGKRVCARSSADRVPGYEPVGHRFKSCRARHIGASNRMLAPISFWELGALMPLFLLFRKRSRSARLPGRKRPRDGSLSRSTFCGCAFGAWHLFSPRLTKPAADRHTMCIRTGARFLS